MKHLLLAIMFVALSGNSIQCTDALSSPGLKSHWGFQGMFNKITKAVPFKES